MLLLQLYLWLILNLKRLFSAARKLLPSRPKLCEKCMHFDVAEGQAIIRANPAFAGACEAITPKRMTERYDDKGNLVVASPLPNKTTWSDFGACAVNEELRWKEDTCAKFVRIKK